MHVPAPTARYRPVRRPMHQVINSNRLYEGSGEVDLLCRAVDGLGTPEIQRESQSVEAYLRAMQSGECERFEAMLHAYRTALIAAGHKQVWLPVWNECRRLVSAHQHAARARACDASLTDR